MNIWVLIVYFVAGSPPMYMGVHPSWESCIQQAKSIIPPGTTFKCAWEITEIDPLTGKLYILGRS